MLDKNLKVEMTEKFNFPGPVVWDALTDRDKVKQYFFGTEVETDWNPGSPIIFRGNWEGQDYKDKGRILEKVDGESVKYSYLSSLSGLDDMPENYSTVSYKLEDDNGGTLLTVIHEGFKDQASRDDSVEGWKFVLDNLRKLLEKQTGSE